MRTNFASKIQGLTPDVRKEYDKLYEIYTEEFISDFQGREYTFEMIFVEHFTEYPFETTCLSLDEFNEECGNLFEADPETFDEDYFLSFAEYFYNMLVWLPSRFYQFYAFHLYDNLFVQQHILNVIETLGYKPVNDNGFTVFVPRDNVALTVSESKQIPENVSHKILSYHHHSMKGDIEAKKATLIILASQLEPQKKALSQIDNSFKSDLFYAFNNLNIRHNNVDSSDKRYYKKVVAEMDAEELERWYDETYQMCLLAFMRLEQNARKKKFDEIKTKIEAKA